MGARGPKPKPTALRMIEGHPNPRGQNPDEPQPTGDPICPDYLSDDAKAKWHDIMSSIPPGMITIADAPLLEAYCEAYSAHKQASEELNRDKDLLGRRMIVDGRPSPYFKIRNEAARTMISIATRLGLSPADRSGLKLGGTKGSGSRWAKLIA